MIIGVRFQGASVVLRLSVAPQTSLSDPKADIRQGAAPMPLVLISHCRESSSNSLIEFSMEARSKIALS